MQKLTLLYIIEAKSREVHEALAIFRTVSRNQ